MKWFIAYLSSIAMSSIVSVLLALIFHKLTKEISFIGLLTGLITAIFILFKCSNLSSGLKVKDFGFWSWAAISVYVLISLRSFLWLVYKNGDSLKVLSKHNLGDAPLHIGYIQYLANGISFWPENPMYAGVKFHYPIGMDLFNGLLVSLGADVIRSLIWIGLLSSIACGFALILWGRAFTLSGFLFAGGLSGFKFFENFTLADYQTGLAWGNILFPMLTTQRGLLFALPAGLVLLCSWRERFFSNKNAIYRISPLPFWIEVLLYSSMPLFHMHTFIYLSLLLGIWFSIPSKDNQSKISRLVIFSAPLAIFLIYFLTEFNAAPFVHIKWGWMQGSDNFFKFWILNFGIFWPLVIWLYKRLVVKVYKDRDLMNQTSVAFVFPALILFILFCIVMMAPSNWDNIKLLMWSYLILLPFLWEYLIKNLQKYLQYLICFVLFFSGFITIVGASSLQQGHEIFKLSELYNIAPVLQKLPREATFAAHPGAHHPLLFWGRKVIMGYPGWIWGHGLDLTSQREKVEKLMNGKDGWEKVAKELGVDYIFWGRFEEQNYPTSLKPWEDKARLVSSGSWGKIYKLELNLGINLCGILKC
ncbi:MAG: hypothetical protein HYY52_07470 [Candidatus Melainabacteria bacterium]|nr:hypothetical protein [Candidatus Melainabacteria bacterium]